MIKYTGHRAVDHPSASSEGGWVSLTCGHCNREGTGAVVGMTADSSQTIRWLQCPICGQGSVASEGTSTYQYPGLMAGPDIEGLPQSVEEAYDEARRCMSVSAFTASEGMCRKILMHVAVEKGAKSGQTFASYVSHLENAGFVTPTMKTWVDLIRKHGNESNHELPAPSEERAESTLMFTAELLRLTYEMEHMTKKYVKPKASTTKAVGAKS